MALLAPQCPAHRVVLAGRAALVALVSMALLLLGISGIYMWFTRQAERRVGMALLAINLIVAVILIGLLRMQGP